MVPMQTNINWHRPIHLDSVPPWKAYGCKMACVTPTMACGLQALIKTAKDGHQLLHSAQGHENEGIGERMHASVGLLNNRTFTELSNANI